MRKLLQVLVLMLCGLLQAIEVNVTLPEVAKRKEASGQEVAVVQSDEPFTMLIEIQGANGKVHLDVQGIEAFKILRQDQGVEMMSFNGSISSAQTLTVELKNDKPGLYKLGPVKVTNGTLIATSKEFYCRVEKTNTALAAALEGEFILPKDEVYCGEPFDVTIRYIAHESIYQFQPSYPEQAHFLIKDTKDRGARQILRNGKMVVVHEFIASYLPIKAGTFAIGPMTVQYVARGKKQRSMGGMDLFLGAFLGAPMGEQKECSVPAVHIRVKELPKNKKKTSLVGQMKEFIIAVDKPTAQVNDPIKLTAMFSGKGNLEFIEELPLELPAGCKVYKAKTLLDKLPGDSGMVAKTVEYVLQVNKSGPIVIPAQQLLYFDPEASAYKTITSNSVELFLTGDVVEQPKKSIDELAKEVNDDGSQKKGNKEPAYIFDDAGRSIGALPWWLFIVLLLLPMLLYVRSVLVVIDQKILKYFKKQPKTKEIIELASKELAGIMPEQLYQFFVKTMAALWHMYEQDVTEQVIEQRLIQLGWDEERVKEFLDYLHASASLHFTKQVAGKEMQEMLLKKSQYWLLLLGKE